MSEILPKGFIEHERRRTFEPDASFARRVITQLRPVHQSASVVWDFVPGFARPLIVVMTFVLMMILAVQSYHPRRPDMGIVDAFLAMDQAPADQWLYRNADLPEGRDLLVEISLSGSSR